MSTVVTGAYNTAGNGGRKIVLLSNWWLVAITHLSLSNLYYYVSKDKGVTWSLLASASSGSKGTATVAVGTKITTVGLYSDSEVQVWSFDATTVTVGAQLPGNPSLDKGLTGNSGISIVADPTNGHLHAAWASKNATYPSSFNIRYSKSIDGGVTWSAVEQVTKFNANTQNGSNPSIVVLPNGRPVIFIEYGYGNANTHMINAHIWTGSVWSSSTVHGGGTRPQTNPSAVVDKDGIIHVAWKEDSANDIRYSSSADGVVWSTMRVLSTGHGAPSITTDKTGRVYVLFSQTLQTPSIQVDLMQIYKDGNVWSGVTNLTMTSGYMITEDSPSTLYDHTFAGEFGTIPPTLYVHSQNSVRRVDYIGTYTTNNAPTLTFNTGNNATLYESDTFKIEGSAVDSDVGDIVNVYYRINGGTSRAIVTGISTGASIPFNEQLTFKAGKLHKDETAITDALAEGPAHRLEVWSEDNKGGKSTVVERTFYVVPNRAPALTVNPFDAQSGMINNDTINLSGTSSDPDGNNVTVKYRVNEQAAVQIHSGVAGPWAFDVSLKSLKDGENIIVVEVTDTYNFKSSRTIKLNKTANLTPLEHSTQRYKIVPPSGSAQGVLLWIQRNVNQAIEAEISMTTGSEQEQFAPMELKNSAPIDSGTIEDDFRYQANELKENIVLKLTWSGDKPILLISGVLV